MALSTAVSLPERVSFARIPDIRSMPSLIQVQLDSFAWFKREGLRERDATPDLRTVSAS
jgi:DNA-directed RNA polymerase subunit beta